MFTLTAIGFLVLGVDYFRGVSLQSHVSTKRPGLKVLDVGPCTEPSQA
jgi:hypothetical protein